MQVVKVKFTGSTNLYTYKCDVPDVNEGDYVIVRARNIMNVAKIEKSGGEELLDPSVSWTYQWVVDKIDWEGDLRRKMLR
jgi:hypothetical protein